MWISSFRTPISLKSLDRYIEGNTLVNLQTAMPSSGRLVTEPNVHLSNQSATAKQALFCKAANGYSERQRFVTKPRDDIPKLGYAETFARVLFKEIYRVKQPFGAGGRRCYRVNVESYQVDLKVAVPAAYSKVECQILTERKGRRYPKFGSRIRQKQRRHQ